MRNLPAICPGSRNCATRGFWIIAHPRVQCRDFKVKMRMMVKTGATKTKIRKKCLNKA